MAKPVTIYACRNCDAQFQKWVGRCLECGQWGSIDQEGVTKNTRDKTEEIKNTPVAKTSPLSSIKPSDVKRIPTTIGELDRVLGGGIVPGSLILLGGEPGIGKSTLSLQLSTIVPNTLYISGEESVGQIKLRADRLKKGQDVILANETHVETIISTIIKMQPKLVIIDSIQTIYSGDVDSEPGNPTQIRACTTKLMEAGKTHNISICIIGHVTKDGAVAGPKTLEHLVDTVLYLEGERSHSYRILRTVKNRFGSTDEVGVFEMRQNGLVEVANPSKHFLEERGEHMSGSVMTCLMEGTRPLLVEVQALVNKTSFGFPVRKCSGFDINRLHVLVAVLQKRARLDLSQYDIHVNIVGGIKAHEPAADLAVCLAIASSFKDKELGSDLVAFGEVGLGGEVRSVQAQERRIKECGLLGMKRVIAGASKESHTQDIKVLGVKSIEELIRKT